MYSVWSQGNNDRLGVALTALLCLERASALQLRDCYYVAVESLGRNALFQKDYASAEKFFFRAVDLNAQVFGESSNQVATSLVQASTVYFADKDYAKAEPYLVRAVRIDESLYGADNVGMLFPRGALCGLYDRWDQTDKAVACNRQLLAVLEKQFGESSPQLVNTLASQAKALRKLGQTAEADKIDQRLAQIRTTTMDPNQGVPSGSQNPN